MIQLKIKEIAANHGLLLKDVCDKAGYKSLPSFYRQINNPDSINMKTLIRIADAIGCEVSDFFDEVKKNKSSDFVAFVRRNDETFTFESEKTLKDYVKTLPSGE